MKNKWIAAALLWALMLAGAMASAQTLPDNSLFSPGLVRLAEKMRENPAVTAEAQISISDAYYARDLSVLARMLEGTVFRYAGDETADRLTIVRGENVLGDYAMTAEEAVINGIRYARAKEEGSLERLNGLSAPSGTEAEEALERLQGVAVLERAPLEAVAAWLEGLRAGDALAFGFAVAEPFSFERTMSDDGERLTRVSFLTGAIAREGETPYAVTGYMRQPAGRAPKDTFELKVTQDEKNFMEISYSALRENTVKSRNKSGEASVRTQLKFAGKVNGSAISSRLTVNMTNAWTADGEALDEKVTVTATLTHKDNTPGRRMQRLNQAEIKLKNVIRMTTHEAGDEVFAVSDAITLEAVMDENAFLTARMDIAMNIGAQDAPALPQSAEPAGEGKTLDEALKDAVRELAFSVYQTLDEKTLENIRKSL
ncbi:MAG: hypothetical protein IJD60_03630 [Clostridia bacterium]|nr:hypothetical protein [Clostridia bacterium]